MTVDRLLLTPVLSVELAQVIVTRLSDDDVAEALTGMDPRAVAQAQALRRNLAAWVRASRPQGPAVPKWSRIRPAPVELAADRTASAGDWITTGEAAQIMGITSRQVRNVYDRGRILGRQQGDRQPILVDRASVEAWTAERDEREARAG